MDIDGREARDLSLLEEIGRDPDATQAGLAARLGVAVGTVNWHLKRMVAKGYVKVKRAERRKLRYIITPEGLALRARLTVLFVENSMLLYRQTRREARRVLQQARRAGYSSVVIDGQGDIADVCRLTCLEVGLPVLDGEAPRGSAVLRIRGREIELIPADRKAAQAAGRQP
jgi:DNA-binding MarR family transcriptional regulator